MKKLIFTGAIYPERAWINLPKIQFPVFTRVGGELGMISMSINNSQLAVVLVLSDENFDILTLKNLVLLFVDRIVSTIDYIHGYSHTVDIVQCIDDSGDIVGFGVGHPVVDGRLDVSGEEYAGIFSLTNGERELLIQNCITDLAKAIKYPGDTAFFCYRAIESLKQYFFEGKNEKEAWKKLSEFVGKDTVFITIIKKYADNARHGFHEDIPGHDRNEILKRTFEVVDTFMNKMFEIKGISTRLSYKNKE